MFLVSSPLNLIQDLRKFKWVNMVALFSLLLLLVISVYILVFMDLSRYPHIYDPDKVRYLQSNWYRVIERISAQGGSLKLLL